MSSVCQTHELCTQKMIPYPLRSDMKNQVGCGYYFLSNIGSWAIKAHSSKYLASSRDWLTAFRVHVMEGRGQARFSRLVRLFLKQLRIQTQVLECKSEDILVPSSCAICIFEFKPIQHAFVENLPCAGQSARCGWGSQWTGVEPISASYWKNKNDLFSLKDPTLQENKSL